MPAISISLVDRTSKSTRSAPRLTSYGLESWAGRVPAGLLVAGKFGSYFDFTSLNGKTASQTLTQIQKAMSNRKIAGLAPSGAGVSGSFSKVNKINGASKDHLLQYLYNWASQSPDCVWEVQKVSGSWRQSTSEEVTKTEAQKSQTHKTTSQPRQFVKA